MSKTTYTHNISKQQLVLIKDDHKNITLGYDKFGNMTTKAYSNGLTQEYTYDDFNHLIKIEDNYGKVIDYTYDALEERTSRRKEFPHDYITLVFEQDEDVEKEYDIEDIITRAKDAANNVIDDKYFCTLTNGDSKTKVIEEFYTNDISREHTQILQIDKANDNHEIYTYGLNRIKEETQEETKTYITNGKLDIGKVTLKETLLYITKCYNKRK